MKECIICKEFDRTSKHMGVCSETGETVGINNSCSNCKPDVKKIEAIAKEVSRLYFDYNMTAEEALQRAKRIWK